MAEIYAQEPAPTLPTNANDVELIRYVENNFPNLKGGLKLLLERFTYLVENNDSISSRAEQIETCSYECPNCGTILQIDLELEF